MQLKTLLSALFLFSVLLPFTACKKGTSVDTSPVRSSDSLGAAVQATDQIQVSAAIDATTNDANLILEDDLGLSERVDSAYTFICDAMIKVDTGNNKKSIIITYQDGNCNGNQSRSGVVVLSMDKKTHWNDAGASLTLSYQDLKITRLSDHKSVTINGAETITNVSGGRLIKLPVLGSITHTINSSDMSVTFDDGSKRTWQLAKKRVFTYNNGIVVTTTGMHTEGSTTNISDWGTNRFGNAFFTSITAPLIIRQDCNFRLTSGELMYTASPSTATLTFGLDASGNKTACPGVGNYYFKLVWSGNKTYTFILPY